MHINNIQNVSFAKIYRVTSNTKNPDSKKVNPDVFSAVMDARGVISEEGEKRLYKHDEYDSRELGEFLKAQIVDWDGSANGLALKHIGGSDYMFTGEDAEKFFRYKKESGETGPETMVESGNFDEISFRFGKYGEISSVEFLNNPKAE